MTPDALTPDDIDRDLAGSKAAEARLAAFFAVEPPRFRSGPSGVGRRLIDRCPKVTRLRYRTILHQEPQDEPDIDYGYHIAPTCAYLEGELRRLVADPAAALADEFIAALAPHAGRRELDILGDWKGGKKPVTIGVLITLLRAIRYGLQAERPAITGFVTDRFGAGFSGLFRTPRLVTCLNQIRDQFRDPACHGLKVFGAADYARFVGLLVAAPRLKVWDELGPTPAVPDADVAVLHHHLAHPDGGVDV